MIRKDFFGKKEATMLAGIAILLMVWHHLFTYSDWLISSVNVKSVFGSKADEFVWLSSRLGNICIYIFAFSTGYVLCRRWQIYDTWRKRIKRILSFLISYWMVCVTFWIFALVFNEPLPTLSQAIYNLFGLHTGYYSYFINVTFAWYVAYYCFLLIVSPLIRLTLGTNKEKPKYYFFSVCCIFAIIIATTEIFTNLYGYALCLGTSLTGYIVAQNDGFEKLKTGMKKYYQNVWICIIGIILSLALRAAMLFTFNSLNIPTWIIPLGILGESTITFLFIFFTISLLNRIKIPSIEKILLFFGEISMFLWFLHGLPFSGSKFLQKYLYWSSEPLLIFLTALIFFAPISMLFNYVYSKCISPLFKPKHPTKILSGNKS